MLPEKYLESDVQYEVPYTKTIDFETNLENDDRTDANLITELRTKANIYLQENKVPKISYTVKSDINDKMEIGDTIQILHPLLSIKTEVLEYEYDNILGKVKSITFGNFTRSIKNKFDNIKTTLNKISNVVSNQEIVINRQTDLINSLNKNGYVYIDDNEILILDRLPKEQATNVWRWGLGGLGFSSHGYEGPFETAITMDGQINANFITTGQLSVSRIEGLANTLNEHSQNIANIELDINGITNTVSSVQTKLNNMQIGGTNLCVGTKLMPTNTQTLKPYSMYFSYNNNINTTELEDNFRAVHITTNDSWKGITCKEFNRLKPKVNEEYIIQTMVKSFGYTGEIGFYAMIYDSNNSKKTGSYFYLEKPDGTHTNSYSIGTILSLSDNTNEKLWLKLKPTQLLIDLINAGGHVELSFQTHNLVKNSNDGYINFWKMKLEKGNMPTDWTPAPEDIESNLEDNYYTKTETESKIDQRADSITSTVTSLQTQVNNIQIGGTNILRGTDVVTALTSSGTWANGTWRSATSGNGTRERIDIIDSPNGNIKKGWRFTRTAESNHESTDIAQDYVPVANGQTYTMSCWARCVSGNVRLRLQYGKNPWRNNGHPNITDTNWKRYSYTFTVGEHSDGSTNGNTMVYFGLFPYSDNSAGVLEICGLKLESGNKATDWSPAPEDIESNLQNNYYTKTETESKIEQKADSITSTVSQTYSTKTETTQAKNEAINSANTATDNKLENYSTTTQMNSAITQKANEITSSVTTIENRLDNMQVGGRNYLKNSKTTTTLTKPASSYAQYNWDSYHPLATKTLSTPLICTLSFRFIPTDENYRPCTSIVVGKNANGDIWSKRIYYSDLKVKKYSDYYFYYASFTIPATEGTYIQSFIKFILSSSDSANLGGQVSHLKLEDGNMPTDWTPAPEDIDSNLTTNYYTKTETETKINQKADNITSTVNKTISNIQTGTENLLLNTAIKENTNNWTLASGITRTTSKTTPNGNYCFYYNISGLTSNSWRCANPADVSVQPGEILTADVNVFIPSSNDIDGEVALEIQYFNSSRTRIGYLKKLIDTTVVDKWQKATVTLEAPTNAAYANARVWVLKNGKFYVGDLILSRGNTSASWAPSSNDYTAKTELGTLIEQNWEHIKVAWNQISQYLQLEGTNGSASLNIYNQSNNKLMTLNANGETYYNGSGNEIGKIGIIRQNNKDILAFSMPVDWNNISSSRSMAWGIFDPNNNFLPIFYLAGLYGANNSEYEGQLVVAGGLSAQDIELEQGIIKASIGGFQVLNNNDQVMLSVLKNGSGSSTYFNLLDLISTWYNTTVGCHYLDFHNNRLANLGNVPVSETNDPNLIKVINNIGGFDDSYIYASFKNGGDVFVYSNSSDRNLKKNIKETNISAIELIQKINHVQFDWKSNERHQSIGYIAQEMQEVEESFVHHSKYKDKEDWQINTLSVLATATKAIQEQQEIIEDLKSRIEKLEKK